MQHFATTQVTRPFESENDRGGHALQAEASAIACEFYDAPMPQFCGLKLSMLVATRSMMEDTLLGIWCIRGRFGHYTPERMRV